MELGTCHVPVWPRAGPRELSATKTCTKMCMKENRRKTSDITKNKCPSQQRVSLLITYTSHVAVSARLSHRPAPPPQDQLSSTSEPCRQSHRGSQSSSSSSFITPKQHRIVKVHKITQSKTIYTTIHVHAITRTCT